MKHLFTPRHALALALSSAVLPLAIVGCGGGNGNSPLKTQPGPTSTAPMSFALTPTTITLDNGQRVTITGTRKSDGTASGKITVANPILIDRKLATGSQNVSLPFNITVGEYDFTGTADVAGAFDINGTLLVQGSSTRVPFRLNGQLPTATAGNYALTINGVSESGTLPAITTPTPTISPTVSPTLTPTTQPTVVPTIRPTVAPTVVFKRVTANLRFSNALPAGAVVTTSPGVLNNSDARYKVSQANPAGKILSIVGGVKAVDSSGQTISRSIAVTLTGSQVNAGATLQIVPSDARNLSYQQTALPPDNFPTYFAQSGSVTIGSLGSSTHLTLSNVLYKSTNRAGQVSSFILDGTITATGVQVIP